MADDRSYLEKAKSLTKERTGGALSPEWMSAEFSKWKVDDRAVYLDQVNAESQQTFSTPREAARHHVYERALRSTHDRLRKIDR